MKKIILLLFLLNIPMVLRAQNIRPEELAKQLRLSTVKIEGEFYEKDVLINDHQSWMGTGVIVEETPSEYIIVTNLHVIGFWEISTSDKFSVPEILSYSIKVLMYDGKLAPIIRIVVNSQLKDYALIYIDKLVGAYPFLPLSEKIVEQGNKVYAMGHPLNINYTFTSGVVSNLIPMKTELGAIYTLIQTDTPINPGNSGGPLVDENGELIGINVGKIEKVGVEGLNFAVSSIEIRKSMFSKEFYEFPKDPNQMGYFVWKLQGKIK